MMGGTFFVMFGIAALAFIVFSIVSAARRRSAATEVARKLGFQYVSGDPLELVRLPHRLFRKGDRRRIATTVWGHSDGRPVALCDYVYTEDTRTPDGTTSSSDTWMSLCAVTLDEALPWIAIAPESLGRRLLNAISVGNDIQFESEEFNRAFTILTSDRDFAFTLIDPAMMEWLMASARSIQLEIDGEQLVAAGRQIPWEDMPGLADMTLEFLTRMPPLVAEKYGSHA